MSRMHGGLLAACKRFARACALAGAVGCAIGLAPAHADEAAPERVQVTDPYIELRTGPGRGYPIYF
ncbi:MAG TPA: hypothetical protein VJ608_03440, partial [Albitalea sp.]|nr:hypothetical protein [Albitalea sp.]